MAIPAKKFGSPISTVIAVLVAVLAFAPSAKADQVCLQVSGQTQCFVSNHVNLDAQDRDFFVRHGRTDLIR